MCKARNRKDFWCWIHLLLQCCCVTGLLLDLGNLHANYKYITARKSNIHIKTQTNEDNTSKQGPYARNTNFQHVNSHSLLECWEIGVDGNAAEVVNERKVFWNVCRCPIAEEAVENALIPTWRKQDKTSKQIEWEIAQSLSQDDVSGTSLRFKKINIYRRL